MMKKASTMMINVIVTAAVVGIAALVMMFLMGNVFKGADGTISPTVLKAKIESCKLQDRDGADNMDFDDYPDFCDPCVDIPDSAENDGNGNGVADYCEVKKSTSKKIYCYAIPEINGEKQENQCCGEVKDYTMTSGLKIDCKIVEYKGAGTGRLVDKKPE